MCTIRSKMNKELIKGSDLFLIWALRLYLIGLMCLFMFTGCNKEEIQPEPVEVEDPCCYEVKYVTWSKIKPYYTKFEGVATNDCTGDNIMFLGDRDWET